MAWVRIHDGAMDHPKLAHLIDWRNPFCLWVWGLSYSQKHLTNGAIPRSVIPNDKAKRAANDLVTDGLWTVTERGYQIHDYLDWNDSRDLVLKKRGEAKERMANARANGKERSSREHHQNFYVDRGVERRRPLGIENVDDELAERAARFLERYDELFTEKRKGAKHFRRAPALDHVRAIDLCRIWDDARLEKLAIVFLTSDDDWIAQTDRGFAVFCAKATWCDERLAAWEQQHSKRA